MKISIGVRTLAKVFEASWSPKAEGTPVRFGQAPRFFFLILGTSIRSFIVLTPRNISSQLPKPSTCLSSHSLLYSLRPVSRSPLRDNLP